MYGADHEIGFGSRFVDCDGRGSTGDQAFRERVSVIRAPYPDCSLQEDPEGGGENSLGMNPDESLKNAYPLPHTLMPESTGTFRTLFGGWKILVGGGSFTTGTQVSVSLSIVITRPKGQSQRRCPYLSKLTVPLVTHIVHHTIDVDILADIHRVETCRWTNTLAVVFNHVCRKTTNFGEYFCPPSFAKLF